MPYPTTPESFWESLIRQDDGCWIHPNKPKDNGYVDVKYAKKTWRSHRLALHLSGVKLRKDLVVDHLCRNRACCNPAHLEQVVFRTNVLRGVSPLANKARQTHCIHGHEFTPENIIMRNLNRHCRACDKAYKKRLRARKQAERRMWRLEQATKA